MCSTTNTLVAGRLPQCALPQTLKWLGDCHSVLYHHTKDGHLPTIVAGLVAGIAAGHIAGLLLQAYDAGLLLQATSASFFTQLSIILSAFHSNLQQQQQE